jgi:hypothetical protein
MSKRRAVIDELVEQYPKYCSSFTFKLQKGIPGEVIHKEGFVNCYIDSINYLVYMHIDKCGSTSITTALEDQKPYFLRMDKIPKSEEFAKLLVEKEYKFFTVVRDPVSRWMSGLNEFMCRYRPPIKYVINQLKDKRYVFDEHTAPQHLFLRLCIENDANLTCIKMNSDMEKKINDVIRCSLKNESTRTSYVPLKLPHLRNSKYFIPNYISVCKKLYDVYIKPDTTHFDKLYSIDIDLYKNAI